MIILFCIILFAVVQNYALLNALLIFCLVLILSYAVELYYAGYEASSFKKLIKFENQIKYDLMYAFLPWTPVYGYILYAMTFGTSKEGLPGIENVKNILPISAIIIFPLQLIIFELISSFLQYWQHRAMHIIPLFWETHKLHHSAEEMTILNLMRETPFTAFLNNLLIALPAAIVGTYLFPLNPSGLDKIILGIYLCYVSFNTFNQFLIHSNAPLDYGWAGRWLWVSPNNHRVHHSILEEHHNKNFSVSWVFWDKAFGTYHEGSTNCPIGYEGNIYNKSRWILPEYLYAMIGFFRMVINGKYK